MAMKGNPLFLLLIGLAVVGLVSQLMFNTMGFLTNLLVTVLVIAIFVALYRYLNRKAQGSGYPKTTPKQIERYPLTKHRKRTHTLRVIEGSKGKKNNPHSS